MKRFERFVPCIRSPAAKKRVVGVRSVLTSAASLAAHLLRGGPRRCGGLQGAVEIVDVQNRKCLRDGEGWAKQAEQQRDTSEGTADIHE